MKKLFLISMIILTVFTGEMFAFFYANHSCDAFNNCLTGGISNFSPNIGRSISEGAVYFLSSYTDMQKFLTRVELSELNGPNYPELQVIIDSAISNMENAAAVYKNLVHLAAETPYNQVIIDKLMAFDYKRFQKKNNLVADVFIKVRGFLAKGNVTGAYIEMKMAKENLIPQLYLIKASVNDNLFPDINLLYQVNQSYCEMMLFGQYIAQVFNSL
ncbi:MAG: hypothetical protein MUF15_09990 [Acidobacteria bacterium]|jgi:hypothetical protein|nr:hypothetical protein [Acidobacteriota bacterium]